MLKVTEVRRDNGTILMLEGKLMGPWIDELEAFWTQHTARVEENPTQVNLKGVSYVDARGANLLICMERQGAQLVEAPDLIWRLIRHDGDNGRKISEERNSKKS